VAHEDVEAPAYRERAAVGRSRESSVAPIERIELGARYSYAGKGLPEQLVLRAEQARRAKRLKSPRLGSACRRLSRGIGQAGRAGEELA
jgi:hypothetical protein